MTVPSSPECSVLRFLSVLRISFGGGRTILTEKQKDYFETSVFVVLPQLFSSDEMQVNSSEFDDVLLEKRGGKRFDGKQRQIVSAWCFQRLSTESLPDDPRSR